MCLMLNQHENTSEQHTEGEMVGNDDSGVMPIGIDQFFSQAKKIFHIEGQHDSPLPCGKRELLDV